MARKYGQKAGEKVEKSMHEFKRGKLKSGKSGKTVKSRFASAPWCWRNREMVVWSGAWLAAMTRKATSLSQHRSIRRDERSPVQYA